MIYVIDTYGWIEYFNGTKKGEKVKAIIENSKNRIYTNIVTVAELASSYKRNELNFKQEKEALLSLSKIYNLDVEFAEQVGELHAKMKKTRKHMGLADIFILLTAKKVGGKVVTGDQDFKGLKETIMI